MTNIKKQTNSICLSIVEHDNEIRSLQICCKNASMHILLVRASSVVIIKEAASDKRLSIAVLRVFSY